MLFTASVKRVLGNGKFWESFIKGKIISSLFPSLSRQTDRFMYARGISEKRTTYITSHNIQKLHYLSPLACSIRTLKRSGSQT